MARTLSQAKIAAFRSRLGAVAERLFAERGPQAVTMRELARALGVSAMTPYRYFADKESILAAVRASAFDRFAAALEQAARTPGNAAERAERVGRAYLDFAFSQPHAYKLMFDLNQPEDGRFPELERAGQRARRTMTGYMEALVAGGFLAGDPEMLGQIFWATVHGLVMLHLAGKLKANPDFATLHRTAMSLLARGAQVVDQLERRRAS
ncbi:MAG TPA: TetR/AcrR family transcriptional regulator [Stellaceae bacterium]|jgi:AcrR family transcriptional regulator|nr:TetR/AcrR family transcriptional regulator [Stellaceae bacterium]